VKEWAGPLRFLLTVGWYMVASLLVPTLLGYFWLDPKFNKDNKDHLFTFVGLGIGTVIAFYGLVRMLRRYKAEQNELNKGKR
jgi:hypothetical protein